MSVARFVVHVCRDIDEGGACDLCERAVRVLVHIEAGSRQLWICHDCARLITDGARPDAEDIERCAFCGSGFGLVATAHGQACPDCGAIESEHGPRFKGSWPVRGEPVREPPPDGALLVQHAFLPSTEPGREAECSFRVVLTTCGYPRELHVRGSDTTTGVGSSSTEGGAP